MKKHLLTLMLSLGLVPLAAQTTEPLLFFPASPYLQNVTPTGVTVMYQSGGSVHSWVEMGRDSLHTDTYRQLAGGQEVVHDEEHRVRIEGLEPGATYYYRVCATEILTNQAYKKEFGRTVKTPFYKMTLPADTTRNFTAIVLNDLHGVGALVAQMARLADSIKPDFVVFNGDCLSEPATRPQAWRMVHSLTSAFHGASTPCIFVRGNHEIRHAYSSGMLSLFDWPDGKTYHAFSWGDTRFVVLDCGEDKPDVTWVYYGLNDFAGFRQEQVDFLQKELAGKAYRKAGHRVLIHHIPLWAEEEPKDPGAVSSPCRELWTPVLKKAGIDVALNGHTHRFRHYDAGETGGLYPVVVGGGPSLDSATMTIIRKQNKSLSLEIINAKGQTIKRIGL
ncbi:MAG: metallophosphoesterase [Alloprevotella sp.]